MFETKRDEIATDRGKVDARIERRVRATRGRQGFELVTAFESNGALVFYWQRKLEVDPITLPVSSLRLSDNAVLTVLADRYKTLGDLCADNESTVRQLCGGDSAVAGTPYKNLVRLLGELGLELGGCHLGGVVMQP